MMHYKGFNIYNNGRIVYQWRVQIGYELLGDYKTIGSAKSAITKHLKKFDN